MQAPAYGKIKMLGQKLAILESLTGSKVDRYKPIIVLEHLQNLRLEGLWFNSLNVKPQNPILKKRTEILCHN